ncbi:MAG TPA: MarR family transcriptional regulator [Chiayiivirga sp.]|nr:MarR family transcriptional regulator [Chiayiivirga sp.]
MSMNSPTPSRPVGIGYLLNDVTRLMRTQFDRRASRLGLTRAQWRALKTLARQEGQTQSELAERIELEPIALGRLVDRLQQAGFVDRKADPQDRRCWRLHLTHKAHAVVDEMEVIADVLRAEILAGIPASDIATTMSVLDGIKNNLIALDGAEPKAK